MDPTVLNKVSPLNSEDIANINHKVPATAGKQALICFSHLRWDFVYQRPQHLMSRFAENYTILFIEEAIVSDLLLPALLERQVAANLSVLVAQIPRRFTQQQAEQAQLTLVEDYVQRQGYNVAILWYFSPMSLKWNKPLLVNSRQNRLKTSEQMPPEHQSWQSKVVVYDCMDELSAFLNAPRELGQYELELMQRANLVFTGGYSLYEAKRHLHKAVYAFPSSVDAEHFRRARTRLAAPPDQSSIAHPRLGFYGVIDERFDYVLLAKLAKARPEWNFVIIGPVVKVDPASLPQAANIHYLGPKSYADLPNYLAGWEVALIPFAINSATRYISPTKTPEYLAAGKPVVATPICDIVNSYSHLNAVHIAEPSKLNEFISALEAALMDAQTPQKIYAEADLLLENLSWDHTYQAMHELLLTEQNKMEVA